jgi:hypothetical protein
MQRRWALERWLRWKDRALLLPPLCTLLCASVLALSACKQQAPVQTVYSMGERAPDGPIVYNVVQTLWKTQFGDLFTTRTPQNRFLVITISATNSGGKEIALPFFTLEAASGKEYKELENGDGVDNWFGLLRTLQPAENHIGNIVFDVPLTSYRLRLTDGGEPGTEKLVWVEIPLRIDTDTSVAVPTPGQN